MRILVIDDEPQIRMLIAEGLRTTGHEILTAASGEEGLEAAAAQAMDLVIADVNLPGIDGFEVTRRVKEAAGEQYLPVIIITAADEIGRKVRGFAAGCDDFLGKPIDLHELKARVHSLLTRRIQHQELKRAMERLRDAERMKEELAALVVHDLRNPLSTLLGNVELLEQELEEGPDLVRECLADCRQLAIRALALVGGLLDVAQLEEGLLRAEPVPVAIAEFLPRCARFRTKDIAHRKIKLECVTEPPTLSGVFDPDLIGRVLENLVDNAIRYVPMGGMMRVFARMEADTLVLGVGNNGPEIPPEERPRIFEKYYRIEDRRAGARANRGLGLYFCKLAAQSHGGSIGIEETPELPACFVLRLPQPVARLAVG